MRSKWAFWGVAILSLGMILLLLNLLELQVDLCGLSWALLLLAAGVRLIQIGVTGQRFTEEEPVTIPLDSGKRARLELVHVAGRLNLGSVPSDTLLVEGRYGGGLHQTTRHFGELVDTEIIPEHGWTRFLLPWQWVLHNWSLGLTPRVPLHLELNAVVDNALLDLTALNVADIKLAAVISSAAVKLPAQAGHTAVKLDAVLSSVSLRVPEGVAARIRCDGFFNSIQISPGRFYNMGDIYQSPDYHEAAHKVDVQVNVVFGSLEVK